ncbi:MAG: molecular chaperone TorD family protein [ANME-2 cluster archaeon]|nr:molecular chaperone TorD family protein [ANME-2 cluster archaeon]
MDKIKGCMQFRNNIYAFLYRMFLEEPPKQLAIDLVKGTFLIPSGLRNINSYTEEGGNLLNEYMMNCKDVGTVYEKLHEEFTTLFIGPGRLPAPPYESMYRDNKMRGPSLLELKQFYREAGVESNDYSEPEDNIAFELRFMNYLGEKLLHENDNTYLELQQRFIDEHLLKWVPDFCDELFASDKSDFYQGIAKFTKGFLLFDRQTLNELF